MPVRRIPRNSQTLTGRYALPNTEVVAFESSLERDFIHLMMFDDNVTDIKEQPVKVPVPGGVGRAAYYVPDFLVQYRTGAILLVEVKRVEDLTENANKYRAKFKAARRYAAEHGWKFKIYIDQDIRTPRLKNIKFLLPYLTRKVDPDTCNDLLNQVKHSEHQSLSELMNATFSDHGSHPSALPSLWHLVAVGKLTVDLNEDFDMDSFVSCVKGVSHGIY